MNRTGGSTSDVSMKEETYIANCFFFNLLPDRIFHFKFSSLRVVKSSHPNHLSLALFSLNPFKQRILSCLSLLLPCILDTAADMSILITPSRIPHTVALNTISTGRYGCPCGTYTIYSSACGHVYQNYEHQCKECREESSGTNNDDKTIGSSPKVRLPRVMTDDFAQQAEDAELEGDRGRTTTRTAAASSIGRKSKKSKVHVLKRFRCTDKCEACRVSLPPLVASVPEQVSEIIFPKTARVPSSIEEISQMPARLTFFLLL
jgi:hypothetical protein